MKKCGLFIFILCFLTQELYSQELIKGQVRLDSECGNQAMVWLSHKNQDQGQELLLHTLVPKKGSYAFSVNEGSYQVWASSPQGCEVEFEELKVERGQNTELNIRLTK